MKKQVQIILSNKQNVKFLRNRRRNNGGKRPKIIKSLLENNKYYLPQKRNVWIKNFEKIERNFKNWEMFGE